MTKRTAVVFKIILEYTKNSLKKALNQISNEISRYNTLRSPSSFAAWWHSVIINVRNESRQWPTRPLFSLPYYGNIQDKQQWNTSQGNNNIFKISLSRMLHYEEKNGVEELSIFFSTVILSPLHLEKNCTKRIHIKRLRSGKRSASLFWRQD